MFSPIDKVYILIYGNTWARMRVVETHYGIFDQSNLKNTINKNIGIVCCYVNLFVNLFGSTRMRAQAYAMIGQYCYANAAKSPRDYLSYFAVLYSIMPK